MAPENGKLFVALSVYNRTFGLTFCNVDLQQCNNGTKIAYFSKSWESCLAVITVTCVENTGTTSIRSFETGLDAKVLTGKMPSTRSQTQPILQFPRRKSSGVDSKSTPSKSTSQLKETKSLCSVGASKPQSLPERAQLTPLSHGPVALKDITLCPRIPLSPRKRTGDENGCNLSATLLGSPPKQPCLNLASPRKLGFDENSPLLSPRRLVTPLSPTSCPRASPSRLHETPSGSPSCPRSEKTPGVRLFAEKSKFHSVKQALHTAVPERLLSREAERSSIRSFLEDKALKASPASLYISGAPGTGKTACLNCVLQEMKDELKEIQTVVLNCMALRSSHAIFPLLAEKLGASGGHTDTKLQKLLTSTGPTVLLVLDEMDQLDSKAQDVLYTIFEWPYLPKSRLCLIGIANALDLTDRILPRLQALPRCRPQLLHFPPYSRQELAAIVQDRLAQVSGEGLLDASAVQFCARKVSAVSGDARKALDICRRAVELVESDDRKKAAETTASRVSVPQVARVLSEVYGDRMSSPEGESFPLQQKLLVCCLLLLTRNGKNKEIPLGKLHEVYSRLCAKRQVGGVGQGECLSLCSLLESRGIFALKKAKEARLTKVSLKIEERDVENALKDRTLLGSILTSGLP
ncbi:cell division control protein 6 homolog isoform X1 [Oncorhynchus keta]|uniref:cell division control protein 6 homolog isoform X1 n=2 Tax=Oncorhynchus keta TaxID=8018 RepID=UPI0015FE613B|nr:cell division control protein 6 homolog isoform X1 [Oncorhynchus keta]